MHDNEFRFLVRKLTVNKGGELETHSLCYVTIKCEQSFANREEFFRKASAQQVSLTDLQIRKFVGEESGMEYLSALSLKFEGDKLLILGIKR